MTEGDLKVAPTIMGGFRRHGYPAPPGYGAARRKSVVGDWWRVGRKQEARRQKRREAGKVKPRTPERFLSALGMAVKGKRKFKGKFKDRVKGPDEGPFDFAQDVGTST
jgi:hypothetical protein